MIMDVEDIVMYLDDIKIYVDAILYYHNCSLKEKQNLDLEEILAYLSSVEEIVNDIKDYLLIVACS